MPADHYRFYNCSVIAAAVGGGRWCSESSHRDWRALGFGAKRKAVGRSRCDARDLTRLLPRATRVSKHRQPSWDSLVIGSASEVASPRLPASLPFQISCVFHCHGWLRKETFFNTSHSSAARVSWLATLKITTCWELCVAAFRSWMSSRGRSIRAGWVRGRLAVPAVSTGHGAWVHPARQSWLDCLWERRKLTTSRLGKMKIRSSAGPCSSLRTQAKIFKLIERGHLKNYPKHF